MKQKKSNNRKTVETTVEATHDVAMEKRLLVGKPWNEDFRETEDKGTFSKHILKKVLFYLGLLSLAFYILCLLLPGLSEYETRSNIVVCVVALANGVTRLMFSDPEKSLEKSLKNKDEDHDRFI